MKLSELLEECGVRAADALQVSGAGLDVIVESEMNNDSTIIVWPMRVHFKHAEGRVVLESTESEEGQS